MANGKQEMKKGLIGRGERFMIGGARIAFGPLTRQAWSSRRVEMSLSQAPGQEKAIMQACEELL